MNTRRGQEGVRRFDLQADGRGAVWDLLLYVPTVLALASVAVKLWFGGQQAFAYVLSFLASFFFFIGANRILKTRLMLLPSAPRAIEVGNGELFVHLGGATRVDVVKDQKLYADMAGRSFGISGLDRQGKRLQFVFHRGQFSQASDYAAVQEALKRLQKKPEGKSY
jgi:hypothetical protein